MNHQVMISAVHPVLGRLYWVYVSGADCNAPDYFGVSDHRSSAMLLPLGWRNDDFLQWRHKGHMYSVFDADLHGCDYSAKEDDDTGELHQDMTGLLGRLQSLSGQTVEEFRLWLFRAKWTDIPKLELVKVETQEVGQRQPNIEELQA